MGNPDATKSQIEEGVIGGDEACPSAAFPVAFGDREGLFAFFDAVSVGMAVVDGQGRIVWANKTLGRIMDRSLKSIQGRRLSRFLGETPSDGAAGSQRDDLCGLPGMPREGTILRKGGGRVPVHLSAGCLCAADGHAYSVVCVTDLTVHGENKEVLKRRAFSRASFPRSGFSPCPRATFRD